jgi:spermidine synthase
MAATDATARSSTSGDGLRRLLAALFAATGFSALTLQVTWQRIISLHSGVDLASTTTVVAAFLGGLGLGSLFGGRLADRVGARRSLQYFAGANVAIGAFAAISTWLFYDLYRAIAPGLGSAAATFAFNAAVVAVPTTLMGLSLPLLTRGVVHQLRDAGPVVGRLYGINTIGAAAGAAITGWLLVGTFGFVTVTLFAGLVNLAVGLVVLVRTRAEEPEPAARVNAADDATAVTSPGTGRPIWPWMVAYAGTGAVALGLEQVFFRLVDTVMRSNSYSFAHVLSLYLLLFGIGAAVGSRLVRRGVDTQRWFLLLQGGAAVGALAGPVLLISVLPRVGLGGPLTEYFASDGFNIGFSEIDSARGFAGFVFAYVVAPLLFMAVPVLCAGAAYPCIQATVSDRIDQLGRRTGALLFANIVGNVAGTLLTGYVLIDRLGTAGTLRLLAGLLLTGVVVAAIATGGSERRKVTGIIAVGAVGAALVVGAPSNDRLWSFLHSADDGLLVEEQRSCAVALKRDAAGNDILHINGSSQNGYPFDDYHVLIGLVPALAHPAPRNVLAIGLGIGATAYGMATDPSVERVEVVELCGGQYPLLQDLAEDRPAFELTRLFADPRVETVVGDGREHLLVVDDDYDVITVDTLRPQSGYSGSLYSREFYEIVAERLATGGVFTQWIPTSRVVNTAAQVFPHVEAFEVAAYGGSRFMVASAEPINFDRDRLLDRFDRIDPAAYGEAQRTSLRGYLRDLRSTCVQNGERLRDVPRKLHNRDLAPRDEYFLNNDLSVPELPRCRGGRAG